MSRLPSGCRTGRSLASARDSRRTIAGTVADGGGGSRARSGVHGETARALAQLVRRRARLESRAEPGARVAVRAREQRSLAVRTVYVDVDTQIDFMYPAGALYVP